MHDIFGEKQKILNQIKKRFLVVQLLAQIIIKRQIVKKLWCQTKCIVFLQKSRRY